MTTEQAVRTNVAFLGLGQMGGPMAGHLCQAGYTVHGYDPDAEACRRFERAGGQSVGNELEAIMAGQVVMLCLPTSDATIKLARQHLLGHLRRGQVVVDLGTTAVPATRELGQTAAARQAAWVDAPISGGEAGAQKANLRLWVGGPKTVVAQVRPLLKRFAADGAITHMGPTGSGQIGKAVHQIKAGLATAAQLEAIAFGLRAGVEIETLAQSFAGSDPSFERMLQHILEGDPCPAESKFYEYDYYLAEAEASNFRLPMIEALSQLCHDQPRAFRDPVNRSVPSIWQALMQATRRPQ